MQKVREPAPIWAVELNIPGCRIRRWANRRRELLGLSPKTFSPPELPLSPSGAA